MFGIPSVPNYRSFDFFDIKFDHLSYSKNLCKHSQISITLEELVLIKQFTTKEVMFCINFLIRRVVKLGVEKAKRPINSNGGSRTLGLKILM